MFVAGKELILLIPVREWLRFRVAWPRYQHRHDRAVVGCLAVSSLCCSSAHGAATATHTCNTGEHRLAGSGPGGRSVGPTGDKKVRVYFCDAHLNDGRYKRRALFILDNERQRGAGLGR